MPALPAPKRPKNTLLSLVIIALFVAALGMMFNTGGQTSNEISLNTFIEEVRTGTINEISVSSNRLNIQFTTSLNKPVSKTKYFPPYQ